MMELGLPLFTTKASKPAPQPLKPIYERPTIRGNGSRSIAEHADAPAVVAVVRGTVVGFAHAAAYRSRPCYQGIGEFSVYVDANFQSRGVGKILLTALIAEARELGYWKLVSRIFDFNTASRKLCQACGFREVGIYEKHGQLDGRWIDCVIVEKVITENLW